MLTFRHYLTPSSELRMSRLFSVKCHFRGNELAHGEETCQNWLTGSTIRCHGSYICSCPCGFRSPPWSIWSCGQIRAPTRSSGPNLSCGFLVLHGLWWQICFAVSLLTSCFVLCILMYLWPQLPSCALLLQLLDFSRFPLHILCRSSCKESDKCIHWLPRITLCPLGAPAHCELFCAVCWQHQPRICWRFY